MFLKTEDLTKTYQTKGKEAIDALKNVSLSFPHNGLVFLLGESGCGKSTFLSMLGGLLKPTSGEIFFKGIPLSSMPREDLASYRFYDVGYVFQENTWRLYVICRRNAEGRHSV
jgi:putative ABC transport system ATP-binding protein